MGVDGVKHKNCKSSHPMIWNATSMIAIESPTTTYFSAAVSALLEQSGHGAQADLARRARVSASYLNDLLSGRKAYWPDPIKERVAAVCGYSVSELLDIGEHYIKDGVFWPHGRHVSDTAARSVERMAKIYQLAARDAGIGCGHILFTSSALPCIFEGLANEYRAGSVSDAKLYSDAIQFCRSVRGGISDSK